MTQIRTPEKPLPFAGPGSTYRDPVQCSSHEEARQIAEERGGAIMASIDTGRAEAQVGTMFPGGRFEVSP